MQYIWDGDCTDTQVGATGSVTISLTPVGDPPAPGDPNATQLYNVTLQGSLSINSPTYGYTRHGLLEGLWPVSDTDYVCEVAYLDGQGSLVPQVFVTPDTYSSYGVSATLTFPHKFDNGL